ncbi:MAG: transglycosylase SLT domain-containing protein, partial [Candidatus Aegiribacteria sp.]
MVLPVLQGGSQAGCETLTTDIPASLSAMSDIQYRPEQFPGTGEIKELVEQLLRNEGVPGEVAALIWVESDFTVGCYSRMGAAGPWQLMPSTGRELGLKIDDTVDERYSWVASTRAAARYLRQLHNIFDDWSLAVAAYNCGPGRVQAGLRNGGSTFGEIELPGETDAFVPRFASAAEAYVQVDLDSDRLAVIWVPSDFDLRLLAAETGISMDLLSELNRSYLLERTPEEKESWEVVVPVEYAGAAFNAAWSIHPRRYLVKEGDSWESVASALGVSPEVLMGMNPAGSLRSGSYIDIPASQRQPVNAGFVENPQYIRYTVRMGDTL